MFRTRSLQQSRLGEFPTNIDIRKRMPPGKGPRGNGRTRALCLAVNDFGCSEALLCPGVPPDPALRDGLVDPALRVRIVSNIAFDRVFALQFLEIVGRRAADCGAFGAADHRIVLQICVSRLLRLRRLGTASSFFACTRASSRAAVVVPRGGTTQ